MPLTDAEKKRAQRKREKAALLKSGGKRLSFLAYGETVALLDKECERFGFKGQQRYAECLTHIIHLRGEETQEASNEPAKRS